MRRESDTLGEIEVPSDKFWGAQTERSRRNFEIGDEKMPLEVIHALALIKKASVDVNVELGLVNKEKLMPITLACDRILSGELDDHFPLAVWQTGSGTQTNMNVNEVIANIANVSMGQELGAKKPIHPNDDVNHSQSSNDIFPTAMHIAAFLMTEHKLIPALVHLRESLHRKQEEFSSIIKVGRTHMMDAVPLTLGQEFSGYVSQLDHCIEALKGVRPHLAELAIGGTAVGTGLNAPHQFGEQVARKLSTMTGLPFLSAKNKFEALAANDTFVELSGQLKRTASALFKIAGDIRMMASGPRSGLGELILPANEPGSSIMPGKVNPTQSEALSMIAIQVMGNDTSIAIAASQGHFELNVYKPLIIYNILQSEKLLAEGALSFADRCVSGIIPNKKRIQENLERSLMLATCLNDRLGYDTVAKLVKRAYENDITLKEAALSLALLSAEEFDALVDPKKMI